FFDVGAIVLFVLRHFFGVIVVTVVSLDRHRRRVPGEEPGGDMNPRDVDREQTKTPGPAEMLMRGEIFEDEARRDRGENNFLRLRPLDLEGLKRLQTGLERNAIFCAERERSFQRD